LSHIAVDAQENKVLSFAETSPLVFGMKSESIVLIGMAGVGKSTIGMAVAKTLGFNFIDVDKYILQKEGKTIQEIIDDRGDEALLQIEKRRMHEIDLCRMVAAPGGSIIYHPDLMEYLKQNSTLIYLEDSFDNIAKKLTGEMNRGIVGLKSKSLREIYEERKPLYTKYADIIINCQGKSQNQIVSEVLQHYSDLRKEN
jgi:shikimate kinase